MNFHEVFCVQTGDQIPGCVHRQNFSVVKNGHSVAQPFRFVHVVSRQHHCPPSGLKVGDDSPKLTSRGRVKAGRWFVKKQQARIPNQRRGDGDSLFLTSGQMLQPAASFFRQRHSADRLVGRQAIAVETAKQRQDFVHCQLFRQASFLERDSHVLPDRSGIITPRPAQYASIPGRSVQQTFQYLDCRRLAGTVRAEDSETLAFFNSQVNPAQSIHRRGGRVGLFQTLAFYRIWHITNVFFAEVLVSRDRSPVKPGDNRTSTSFATSYQRYAWETL